MSSSKGIDLKIDDSSNCEPKVWDKSFLDNYDTFMFDMDGVLWLQLERIDGVKDTILHLQSLKKNIIFITNGNSYTIDAYQSKILKLYDIKIDKNYIYSAGYAAPAFINMISNNTDSNDKNSNTTADKTESKSDIQSNSNNNTNSTSDVKDTSSNSYSDMYFDKNKNKVLLIGSEGLNTMITDENIKVLWTNDKKEFPKLRQLSLREIADLELDYSVKAVICAWDPGFTINDVSLACRYLNEIDDCIFIGSDDDICNVYKRKPHTVLLPATGIMVNCIRSILPQNKSAIIVGKPNKLLFDLIKNKHQYIDAKKTLMIGDRLTSDILFGKNSKLDTLLVFTGVTSKEDLKNSTIQPDFVLPSVKQLI